MAALLTELEQLNADLEVPTPEAYGIDRGLWFDSIPLMARQAIASGSPGNNPRLAEAEEIEQLYRRVWA